MEMLPTFHGDLGVIATVTTSVIILTNGALASIAAVALLIFFMQKEIVSVPSGAKA